MTAQHRVDLEFAEEMGYDCGMNGPSERNCHFAIFSAPEFTKAWESGVKRAEAQKRSIAAGGEV
jgi:ribosome modulation factor